MNACELVTKAFYLSGVVARELETVTGSQESDGIDMLNDLLSEASANGALIPYYTHSTLNTVVGQEEYTVANLIDIDAVTFTLGDVRYSMLRVGRKQYFGSSRANNVESLPASYYFERQLGGAKLYLYYLPVDVYQVQITGKFSLSSVDTCTDMSTIVDNYYVSYLRYALAKRIADTYDVEFNTQKIKTLSYLKRLVFKVDPPDTTIKKVSTLSNRGSINYAEVNIGRGFYP